MRIIAGQWRGRPIAAPPGSATRPTSDRAREGLFSMLASRLGGFEGLAAADLFAGSGALGLEALSRGAASCLFVERDPAARAAIEANIARLGAGGRAQVRGQPVETLPPPPAPLDLVLADPPYRHDGIAALLARLAGPGWLAPGALLGIESAAPALEIPHAFVRLADRRYGKAHIHLLRRD
ncbi:MAG: 16S rRNA (guanine(966)-N(2))-methyltransferase RsmD [Sphingomonadaceae bacterium]